ncbi:MAG: helix-turn-helix transcriptional regulator [Sulfurimonas sp.]|nr:helix-turn-helix transcriptional regulator [Sulfurimonas sp.]MDQ7059724.1 helix-turn-helix transcriptional regulator [Sulfurimonas sp.]
MSTKIFLGMQVKQTVKPEYSFIDDTQILGKVIRHKRTSLGMTMEKTAQLCGVSSKSLSQLENGSNVRIDTVFKILNILSIKIIIDE